MIVRERGGRHAYEGEDACELCERMREGGHDAGTLAEWVRAAAGRARALGWEMRLPGPEADEHELCEAFVAEALRVGLLEEVLPA